ncbi:expressed unknown protein [Seminavis robusta]|uniref:DUF6824 domain-containing protein n=1 Tax=Seminavis robusta TaxID=568900 RepID=A0A9N8E3B2_9STRA|nr:expressed unknown protein [Seminavis robusta]|eukprot:Sro574_g169210.1 n/a (729) ;mRNA; f:33571-35757
MASSIGTSSGIPSIIKNPARNDILCGKGKECNAAEGSQRYRLIIDSFRRKYSAAATRTGKMEVTMEIYRLLVKTKSRFLRYNEAEQGWAEIPFLQARDKIGHALRFANRSNRRTPEFKGALEALGLTGSLSDQDAPSSCGDVAPSSSTTSPVASADGALSSCSGPQQMPKCEPQGPLRKKIKRDASEDLYVVVKGADKTQKNEPVPSCSPEDTHSKQIKPDETMIKRKRMVTGLMSPSFDLSSILGGRTKEPGEQQAPSSSAVKQPKGGGSVSVPSEMMPFLDPTSKISASLYEGIKTQERATGGSLPHANSCLASAVQAGNSTPQTNTYMEWMMSTPKFSGPFALFDNSSHESGLQSLSTRHLASTHPTLGLKKLPVDTPDPSSVVRTMQTSCESASKDPCQMVDQHCGRLSNPFSRGDFQGNWGATSTATFTSTAGSDDWKKLAGPPAFDLPQGNPSTFASTAGSDDWKKLAGPPAFDIPKGSTSTTTSSAIPVDWKNDGPPTFDAQNGSTASVCSTSSKDWKNLEGPPEVDVQLGTSFVPSDTVTYSAPFGMQSFEFEAQSLLMRDTLGQKLCNKGPNRKTCNMKKAEERPAAANRVTAPLPNRLKKCPKVHSYADHEEESTGGVSSYDDLLSEYLVARNATSSLKDRDDSNWKAPDKQTIVAPPSNYIGPPPVRSLMLRKPSRAVVDRLPSPTTKPNDLALIHEAARDIDEWSDRTSPPASPCR